MAREQRKRAFTTKELAEIATGFEDQAATIRSMAKTMSQNRIRAIAIDGATLPTRAREMLRTFVINLRVQVEELAGEKAGSR